MTINAADMLNQVLSPDLIEIRQAYVDEGFDVRPVGGAVRDIMSGKRPKDIDLCTDATPDEQVAIYKKHGFRYFLTGVEHGTITVLPRTVKDMKATDVLKLGIEITSLRTESEHDGRYAKMTFTRDWLEDLRRRDLTVNAMALTFDGQLIDPFNGRDDLSKGLVRFVGSARERIREDYLRILRFFRFYGRIGQVSPDQETLDAIQEMAAGMVNLSGERVWMEMSKILVGPNARAVLEMIHSTGVASVVGLPARAHRFPDVEKVGLTSRDPVTALSMLLVDEDEVLDLSQRWKWSSDERELGRFLVNNQEVAFSQADYESMLLDKVRRDWLVAAAHTRDDHAMVDHMTNWVAPTFPVNGKDLMDRGVKPGPTMGQMLGEMKARWKASQYTLTKADLLA